MRRRARVGILGAVVLALAACTSGTTSARPGPSAAPDPLPRPQHVLVVVFENKSSAQVVGAPDAPYLSALAGTGATFVDAHAEAHPSQPNYLALFSGSTHGVRDDSCPQSLSGPTLGGQLLQAGQTFVGYSEDLPAPGSPVCRAGGYARKHNPWVDFPELPAAVNQPLRAFPADNADLPRVAFVVPNLCHDMHDCGVAAGDAWAHQNLAPYVAWARQHDSLLIVTFDEDEGSAANHIPTFLVGPMVRAGDSSQRIDHYSLLRTIEEMYGLPPLGEAADREPLSGIWRSPGG